LLDTVQEHAKHLVPLYDQYDNANDRMAIICLLDSLVPRLANSHHREQAS
jgi:hypothetical protein